MCSAVVNESPASARRQPAVLRAQPRRADAAPLRRDFFTASETIFHWHYITRGPLRPVRKRLPYGAVIRPIRLRAAIAVELPGVAHLADPIEVQVSNNNVIRGAGGSGQNLTARVAKVALSVELTDSPRLFPAGPVDGTHKIAVGDRVGGLFQLPKILG